jgi:hypothetical protein
MTNKMCELFSDLMLGFCTQQLIAKRTNTIKLSQMDNNIAEVGGDKTSPIASEEIEITKTDEEKSTSSPGVKSKNQSKKKGKKNPTSYCVCGFGDGDMVGCDGERCEGNNWYHLECLQTTLGISEQRSKRLRGNWLCPSCTEKAAKAQENQTKRSRRSVAAATSFHETEFVLSPMEKGKAGRGLGSSSSLPPLRVEAAERQSREEMEGLMSTARLLTFAANGCVENPSSASDFPNGLSLLPLPAPVFAAVKSLHEVVVEALEGELRLTPWAGVGESDARKRGYAFLPSRFGSFGKSTLSAAGVRFHAAEKRGNEAKKDETANWNSCFRLKNSQVTSEHEGALRAVVDAVAAVVPAKYKPCITLDQLQALQPNLHNGLDHLPVHMGEF